MADWADPERSRDERLREVAARLVRLKQLAAELEATDAELRDLGETVPRRGGYMSEYERLYLRFARLVYAPTQRQPIRQPRPRARRRRSSRGSPRADDAEGEGEPASAEAGS